MKKEFQKFTDEMKLFSEEFYPESDRSAVIVGASQIDIELTRLISKVLKPKTSKKDELLESDNPLSTFSAKINLAYRLGLIDENFKSLLLLFKKLRNDMSHQVLNCSLDLPPHSDRIKELYNKSNQDPFYRSMLKIFPEQYANSESSAIIKTFIMYMLGHLSATTYWVEPLYDVNNEYLINSAIKC